MNWIKRKWKHISAEPKTVRNFGFILFGILFTLGLIAFLRGHHQFWFEWPLAFAVLYIDLRAFHILLIIYRIWMLFAEAISWVFLRLILGLFYYLILSPVGIIMRFSGRDVLEQTIDRGTQTYWVRRSAHTKKEQYERLF